MKVVNMLCRTCKSFAEGFCHRFQTKTSAYDKDCMSHSSKTDTSPSEMSPIWRERLK